jgi:RTX calcium-binding nonapeptide repeat (4 copies)
MNRTALRRASFAAAVFTAVGLGVAAHPASAAFTARVKTDTDTLKITGDAASDKLALRLQSGNPNVLQVDVDDDGTADFSFDRSTFSAVEVDAGAGDDQLRIDQSGGVISGEDITLNGGGGDDRLIGGAGPETFVGGGGDDFVDGKQGADSAVLGGGNDRFQWDPGDGSDVVEGGSGKDALDFNGSNIAEHIEVNANGPRVLFTRNVANIAMDLDGIEDVNFRALGGADEVVVGNLRGTDVDTVDADLSTDDGQPDTVTANGTDGPDQAKIVNSEGLLAVSGLGALTRVVGGEEALDNLDVAALGGDDTASMAVGVTGQIPANVDGGTGDDTATYSGTSGDDEILVAANGTEASTSAAGTARFDTIAEHLDIRGLDGADTISAVGNLAALTALTMEGGDGSDTLRGGNGADVLDGGPGDDFVDGNQGNDQAFLGSGDDRFQWDPGDGSDTVEGQGGKDALDFNGSNIGEHVEVTANGERVRFTRNVANIVMDLDGIESVNFRALGGADEIVVGSLTGTDVGDVGLDLNATGGGGDGQPDAVTVIGSDHRDVVSVTRSGGEVVVAGLSAATSIIGAEPALDTLLVQTLAGNDDVTVAPDVGDLIATTVDLGADG